MDAIVRVDPNIDPARFRRTLGHYPTGVCLITAIEPDVGPAAMVVGSFTSVSLDPPLVAFFPDRSSTSWPRIQRAGRFCVHVLGVDQLGLCQRFASKTGEKFAGLDYRLSTGGSPMIDGVVAWVDCEIDAVHEAGDHFIVVGRVIELDMVEGSEPLLFLRGAYGGFAATL